MIANAGEQCHEVNLYFVDAETISSLHRDFFDDPTVTDCISFPIDDAQERDRLLGEVFVCPAVALQYAEDHQLDPYEEVSLYIIHGLLHLMGYDDIETEDQTKMRQAEQHHIAQLREAGLLLKPPRAKRISHASS